MASESPGGPTETERKSDRYRAETETETKGEYLAAGAWIQEKVCLPRRSAFARFRDRKMFGGIAVDCGRSCESLALDCSEVAVGQKILLLLRLANNNYVSMLAL